MRVAGIFGYSASSVVTIPFQIVKVKRNWDDPWTIIPWLTVQNASDGSTKGCNDMIFEWRFGFIIQPGSPYLLHYPWLNIAGCYIALDVMDQYGTAPLWIGIVDEHTVNPFASTTSAGIQTFRAIGLKQLLYHKPILGSWVKSWDGVGFVDEIIPFNESNRTEKFAGDKGNNRSELPNEYGVFYFDEDTSDTEKCGNWSHANVIDYLLFFFANLEMDGGPPGPRFFLACPPEVYADLDSLVGTFTCEESVGIALDTLLNERRGISCRMTTLGLPGTPVFIEVFSLFEEMNPDVVWVDTFTNLLEPTITFNRTHNYDAVRVTGGDVCVCTTFSPGYENNGFAPVDSMWSDAIQTEYESITGEEGEADAKRGTERYRSIYSRFRVPVTWDWKIGAVNASPLPADDVTLDFTQQRAQFGASLRFSRDIPFYEAGHANASPALRKAFVLVKCSDPDETGEYWYYVERLSKGQLKPCSVAISDENLSFLVEAPIPHLANLNGNVPSKTLIEAQHDYHDYLFTAMIRTNSRIRCVMPIANTTVPNEVPHIAVIEAKGADVIIILEGTVIDVDKDDATQVIQSEFQIFRNDGQRVFDNAILAAKFYSQQQCVCRITCRGIRYDFWPGSIVAGLFTAEGFTSVGTVVVSRQWNFEENTTTISTGFFDINMDKSRTTRTNGGTLSDIQFMNGQQIPPDGKGWKSGMPVTLTPVIMQDIQTPQIPTPAVPLVPVRVS